MASAPCKHPHFLFGPPNTSCLAPPVVGACPDRILTDVHGEPFLGGGVRGQDSRLAIRSDFLWCARNYPEGDATREERGE